MSARALGLFSGGLDSILACRLLMAQGVQVTAVKFVSPFFGHDLLNDQEGYRRSVRRRYGIDVVLRDISREYIELLKRPAHGYGKHFNPCLDCKIFMMRRARRLMEEFDADFIFSGEVVGQRPMSQRRDALNVVVRDAGCKDVLLRPLCAQRLPPTPMEENGLVDRQRLRGFSGRTRQPQMELAREFGITDYPSPAGGCILTDPVVGERIKKFYARHDTVTVADMLLIQVGRQFRLPGGAWLVMGRKKVENTIVSRLAEPGDLRLRLADRPGPTAVLRFHRDPADLDLAAGLVARYGKKGADGRPRPGTVEIRADGDGKRNVEAVPVPDSDCRQWLW